MLHICSYYVGSRLYRNLFSALEKLGVQQSVYVFTAKGYQKNDIFPSNVYLAPSYNKYLRPIFHLKHWQVLQDIRGRIDITEYNVAHAHSLFSNGYIAYRLKKEFGIPYIVAVRNTDVNVFFKHMPHLRRLGVKILHEASNIIFISESYKQYTLNRFVPQKYRKSFMEKSLVLPNGIDAFWHKNRFRAREIRERRIAKIIYVGSVDRNKNVESTIAACNILLAEDYDVEFIVVGKIIERRYIQIFAKHDFVRYIPHCTKEELIHYYRESDIFVMPSRHETFGLVYAEAMSQGLPVIYTRGQGFDGQFADGEVGYSVKHDAADEIAEKIKRILQIYGEISRRALKNSNKYDWKTISQEYIELYSLLFTKDVGSE